MSFFLQALRVRRFGLRGFEFLRPPRQGFPLDQSNRQVATSQPQITITDNLAPISNCIENEGSPIIVQKDLAKK